MTEQSTEQEAIISLGTETPWGTISSVGLTGGERYYWITDEAGVVAMIPHDTLVAALAPNPEKEPSDG